MRLLAMLLALMPSAAFCDEVKIITDDAWLPDPDKTAETQPTPTPKVIPSKPRSLNIPLIGNLLGNTPEHIKATPIAGKAPNTVSIWADKRTYGQPSRKPTHFKSRFGKGQVATLYTKDDGRIFRVDIHFARMSKTLKNSILRNFPIESTLKRPSEAITEGYIKQDEIRVIISLRRDAKYSGSKVYGFPTNVSRSGPAILKIELDKAEWYIMNNEVSEDMRAKIRKGWPAMGMTLEELKAAVSDKYRLVPTSQNLFAPTFEISAHGSPRVIWFVSLENNKVILITKSP